MAPKSNTAPIDIDFLLGSHHKMAPLSEIDQRRYLSLWGLGLKLGRELLPRQYHGDDLSHLRTALGIKTNSVSVVRTLSVLCSCRLLVLPVLESCKRIAVVGLNDRYPMRSIEVFDPAPWFGSVWIGSDRIGLGCTAPSTATPSPASAFVSDFPEVFEVLQSIDAKGYRTLKPTEGFERDLVERVHCLGRDRVIAEAKALRTWLDGKFQTGQKRRDARFNPQSQFINWLKKAEAFDKDNANGAVSRNSRQTQSKPRVDTTRFDRAVTRPTAPAET